MTAAVMGHHYQQLCMASRPRTLAAVSFMLLTPLHADWLLAGQLQKMVMVVTSCVSKRVLERWTFDILTDPTAIAAA